MIPFTFEEEMPTQWVRLNRYVVWYVEVVLNRLGVPGFKITGYVQLNGVKPLSYLCENYCPFAVWKPVGRYKAYYKHILDWRKSRVYSFGKPCPSDAVVLTRSE